MYYKKINDLMYKQVIKNLKGYEKVTWGDDPDDDRFLWFIPTPAYAAYKILKSETYVLLRDEPLSEELMKRLVCPTGDSKPLTMTGNERKVDKKTLVEFEFEDGEKMYINKDLLKPFDDCVAVQYEAKNNISPMFVRCGDEEPIGLVLPVRV